MELLQEVLEASRFQRELQKQYQPSQASFVAMVLETPTLWIWFGEINIWWDNLVFQRQGCFKETCQA